MGRSNASGCPGHITVRSPSPLATVCLQSMQPHFSFCFILLNPFSSPEELQSPLKSLLFPQTHTETNVCVSVRGEEEVSGIFSVFNHKDVYVKEMLFNISAFPFQQNPDNKQN